MDYADFVAKYGPKEAAIPVGRCQVRALYSWSGEQKTDLGFVEGDIIDVASTGDGDWWVGRLKRNRVTGSFPRNFVEFVDPHQQVRILDTAVHDLDILSPLTSSQATTSSLGNSRQSKTSVLSTEDFLKDISNELKGLSSSLDSRTHQESAQEYSDGGFNYSFERSDSEDGGNNDLQCVPAPPPHKFLPSTSGSSARSQPPVVDQFSLDKQLMRKITDSPDFEEIPFDPRSFAPTQPDSTRLTVTKSNSPNRAKSGERVFSGLSTRSRSVEYFANPGTRTTHSPPKKQSGSNRFVKKLFSKWDSDSRADNGLSLTRTVSASSRLSTISSASRIKRSLLTPFKSWAKNLRDSENEFYPSNLHQGSLTASIANSANTASAISKTTASNALLDPRWMDNQRNLYRSRTLTTHELEKRTKASELRGIPSVSPFDIVAASSTEFHDFRLENFDKVDQATINLSTWPQLMTPAVFASSYIGRRFSDPVERLRAVFVLCAFHITALKDIEGPDLTDIQGTLSRAMHTKMATPLELAHVVESMCGALDIPCQVIRGHLRTEDTETAGKPHSWNAVNIEGEWRLFDASAAARSSPHATSDEINTHYFLCPPQQMIYSHIPTQLSHQFLNPPVPIATAVTLPLVGPAVFAHGIELVEFSPGLLYLQDYDMCELKVAVPSDKFDIVAVCKCKGDKREGAAIAQPVWEGNRRLFRVKACLPQGSTKGKLYLYLADRSKASHNVESMSLLYTMTLYHQGSNAPFEFLRRFPTPQAQRHDIYISGPQCRELGSGQPYTFEIDQHPSKGITPGSGLVRVKLAVQSPSGRIVDLTPRATGPSDTWKATVRVLEVGTWRVVVSADDGQGWVSVGEWFCS